MFNHVCANCGRLLYSRTDHSHLPREIGVAGPACQLRGQITDWFVMPPFLLLWSKKALAKFLRSLMVFDETTNALRLKNGWLTAPWLHLEQQGAAVHDQNPWMYCTDCHDYMIPSVKVPSETVELQPKSSLRIPMRNRQEALYLSLIHI